MSQSLSRTEYHIAPQTAVSFLYLCEIHVWFSRRRACLSLLILVKGKLYTVSLSLTVQINKTVISNIVMLSICVKIVERVGYFTVELSISLKTVLTYLLTYVLRPLTPQEESRA